MQLGVVDSCEVPLTNFSTSGFGEVQKYYAWINYVYDPIAFVASLDFSGIIISRIAKNKPRSFL